MRQNCAFLRSIIKRVEKKTSLTRAARVAVNNKNGCQNFQKVLSRLNLLVGSNTCRPSIAEGCSPRCGISTGKSTQNERELVNGRNISAYVLVDPIWNINHARNGISSKDKFCFRFSVSMYSQRSHLLQVFVYVYEPVRMKKNVYKFPRAVQRVPGFETQGGSVMLAFPDLESPNFKRNNHWSLPTKFHHIYFFVLNRMSRELAH